MKKLLSLLIALVLVSVMIPAMTASATYDMTYTAPKGTPTVDGEIDELWSKAEWTLVDKPHDGTNSSDSQVRIKMMWDEDHIYFLAEVYDTSLNNAEDMVEIYLDLNNDKASTYGNDDSHTRFKVAGGVDSQGKNAQTNALTAAKDLGNNTYIVEGALSWGDKVPAAGDAIGLEFMYNDGNSLSAFIEAYRWNANTSAGDPAPYQSTAAFGVMYLEGEPEAPETPETPDTPANPETSDNLAITVGVLALAAAGVVIASKKRR